VLESGNSILFILVLFIFCNELFFFQPARKNPNSLAWKGEDRMPQGTLHPQNPPRASLVALI
jgi:hypothetical protein